MAEQLNMTFSKGQRISDASSKGRGHGTILHCDVDPLQTIAPATTYTVKWDDGRIESHISSSELIH
jgi:hypothetical protein